MTGFDRDTTIRRLLEDFHVTVLPSHEAGLVQRDLSLATVDSPRVGNLVKVVTGMRRSGKTYRLYQEIFRLKNEGVPESRICFFNFDDDRLRPYPPDVIDRVLEIFYEMHPDARELGAYLFLDEVQDVPGWDVTWSSGIASPTRRSLPTLPASPFLRAAGISPFPAWTGGGNHWGTLRVAPQSRTWWTHWRMPI